MQKVIQVVTYMAAAWLVLLLVGAMTFTVWAALVHVYLMGN